MDRAGGRIGRRSLAIIDTLHKSGGISALSRQLGASPAETMAAVDVLIPGLIADFQNYGGGMQGLLELIEAAGGGALAQAIMGHEPLDPQPGIELLAQIQNSAVSDSADLAVSAIEADLRQRMMPMLAMLLGGYLAARAASGGLDLSGLSSLLDARKTFYSPGEEQV